MDLSSEVDVLSPRPINDKKLNFCFSPAPPSSSQWVGQILTQRLLQFLRKVLVHLVELSVDHFWLTFVQFLKLQPHSQVTYFVEGVGVEQGSVAALQLLALLLHPLDMVGVVGVEALEGLDGLGPLGPSHDVALHGLAEDVGEDGELGLLLSGRYPVSLQAPCFEFRSPRLPPPPPRRPRTGHRP